jgi:hypothetical protein
MEPAWLRHGRGCLPRGLDIREKLPQRLPCRHSGSADPGNR